MDPGPEGPLFRGQVVQPDEFTLVVVGKGDGLANLSGAEAEAALEGHFQFMEQLASANALLVVGQFEGTAATNDLRGLFVMDGESVEACRALAASDPAVKLGLFRLETFSIMAPDMIRHLPAMYRELEAAQVAQGRDPLVPVLADYVVMVARDGKSAFRACTHEALASKVLLLGRMGEPMEGALFGIFDASDPAEIRARLAVVGCDLDGIELKHWLASPVLRRLVSEP